MTETADVVIIGGGAVGLAVAVQLLRARVGDVVVVERAAAPGMGSTSRANGGVRAQFATAANVRFSQYTIDALEALDVARGRVGLQRVGYLFITGTADGEARLREAYRVQHEQRLDVEWLRPDDVLRIAPFVRADGLRAGTFCAGDGLIDPHGVVSALADEVRARRGRILTGCDVTAINATASGCVVTSATHAVHAHRVVNAAGPQARAVAALGGVDLPVETYKRNLACTEPAGGAPPRIPMCVDADTGILVRREGGAFVVAYSDPDDAPSCDTSFDPSFLDAVAARVGNRFPFLESVPIDRRKCWAGLYPETPDHQAIVGAPAAAPAFLQCAGFGGHGIMHSLAAGLAITELIRDGRCTTFDITPFDPDRFARGVSVVETAVL